ncbi:Crotonase core [Penicillium cf. griseofulvum]|uniref:Crotonase core n=1 Tax=Penicillium cf. griseofulvum TaxID=2972120 RepID=A0A9W9J322_9EURO|nr:Crotonase core [Penicillium cf. griseofulvum]KAJ5434624.1 Crotonase core [Penicillium cf. griseofulvum]KAJ5452452.1 Crotonase core [Penicillium cf. griseofulvum]
MIFDPDTIDIPKSYETLPLADVKVSHHPAGAPEATSVIVVTLNRPEKNNSFTLEMMHVFENIYPMFDVDERVKVVVLTGTGKMFCAGADLERGFSGVEKERNKDHRDSGGRLALAIHRCRKPTIAAMQGSAVGLGMTMCLPAAIRISCQKSKYGFVFPRRGLTMESSSSFFLPRLIGYSNALYLITTGSIFPPTSPHFGTLFQETYTDTNQVVALALELATEVAENVSPMASYISRKLMWRNPGSAEKTHLIDSEVLYHMFSGRDSKEGIKSFFEKRKPNIKATLESDAPPGFPWWSEVDTGRRPKASKAKL